MLLPSKGTGVNGYFLWAFSGIRGQFHTNGRIDGNCARAAGMPSGRNFTLDLNGGEA